MKALFDSSSLACSRLITKTYSTSFSLGIRLFAPSIRPAIYAIYGFVRYADEIVDSFHDYEQQLLFDEFVTDYRNAIQRGISLNPIINSFQEVARTYKLQQYAEDFLVSMRYDLYKTDYNTREDYEHYIYGSAEVVGLMCLRVFVNNDDAKFFHLKDAARHLGAAFQKVNFLRDIRQDSELGRSYFPDVRKDQLSNKDKELIIKDIEHDFKEAFFGIIQLPIESRLGVYVAFRYYLKLLHKLKRTDSTQLLHGRIRVSNPLKFVILTNAYIRYKFNLI